ncbi:hypothetical protein [Marinifilum fragile]|uniref:hypothetical protein n=1 Tax=Marinifilum fragile TaxID=570161 RepID=UPI002AA759AD|nr:hypothetical protein [Marinifilum fragile]
MSKQNFFNIILIIIFLITIGFSIFKVTPFTITGDTFIGIIAAFIGIIVTLHIGFQIIKYLEIKDELKEIKTNREEIIKAQKQVAISENKSQEIYYTLLAKSMDYNQNCVERFLTQLEALIYALKTDTKDFDDIFKQLRTYITKINYGPIYRGSNITRDEVLAEYIAKTEKIESQIKASNNYCRIKYGYEPIMRSFYKRLEKARNNEPVSSEEKQEIMREQDISLP